MVLMERLSCDPKLKLDMVTEEEEGRESSREGRESLRLAL